MTFDFEIFLCHGDHFFFVEVSILNKWG